MKKQLRLPSLIALLSLFAFSPLAADELKVGVVNLKNCLEESKMGQQEKNRLEGLKKQMADSLDKTEKELTELAKKLESEDYLDSLSPSAEEELKGRFQELNQEYVRTQNQYFQLLNQANYRMLGALQDSVENASEAVRARRKLSLVFNRDALYAYLPALDITTEVIQEMDKNFQPGQGEERPVENPAKK